LNWSTRNLDVEQFRNGDSIFQARTENELKYATSNGIPAFIELGLVEGNHLKYGYLYNGYAAFDKRGLIPRGYRMPDGGDYIKLLDLNQALNKTYIFNDDVQLFDDYTDELETSKKLTFVLAGTQDPYGASVGYGDYVINWARSELDGDAQWQYCVTIVNDSADSKNQLWWGKDGHLENFYFIRTVKENPFISVNTSNGDSLISIEDLTVENRDLVLRVLSTNGDAIRLVDDSLKSDRDEVMVAVASNGKALVYANPIFHSDQEIIRVAAKSYSRAFQMADDPLKANREFVLDVVSQNGEALKYADSTLRKDPKVIFMAYKQIGEEALGFADESLREDKGFIKKCERAYR